MKNIMLSGADGTGKSTILKELQETYQKEGIQIKPVWLRFHHYFAKAVNSIGRLTGRSYYKSYAWGKIGYHDYNGFFGLIYIYSVFLDHIIFRSFFRPNILKQQANTVIFIDRYVLDIVADLIVDTGRPELIFKLFNSSVNKELAESNAFILTCPKDIVVSRRTDIKDDESYDKKIAAFQLISSRYNIPQLNTGILAISDTVGRISQL